MDYFKLLNLKKEPFSNSPDLEFFYPTQMHVDCLQKLEMALRFKRGLNVILGDVGTGKTTLCRQLIMRFDAEQDKSTTEIHLIMDPSFKNAEEFLIAIERIFGIYTGEPKSELHYKEEVKRYLYAKGVDEGKIVVLVIDEGQKIPGFCLEILREFLNYETGKHKLLQIVIFAQNEFNEMLQGQKNLQNRVNLCYQLRPLSFVETYQLIKYRIENASNDRNRKSLFSIPGMYAVYLETKGYPRTINMLCHHVLVGLIVKNKKKAGWGMVRFCAEMNLPGKSSVNHKGRMLALTSLLIILVVSVVTYDIVNLRKYIGNPGLLGEVAAVSAPAIDDSKKEPQNTAPSTAPNTANVMTTAVANERLETVVVANDIQSSELSVPPVPFVTNKPESVKTSETNVSAVSDAPVSTDKIPDVLGVLTVPAGDTVINLLYNVYGHYNNAMIDAFMKINPGIKDANVIAMGQRVLFPAVKQVNKLPEHNGKIFVQIASTKSIDQVYKMYSSYPKDQPPVSIVPTWNKTEGLVFTLLLKSSFADVNAAQTSLKTIPASVATNTKLIDKWDKNTVFFRKIGEGA
ncbi:MAG: AAA family ATPase [Nitrospirota bacterium]